MVTSRLTETVIDCADPWLLAQFWAAALGYAILERRHHHVEIGPVGVADEDRLAAVRSGPAYAHLVFEYVPEGKQSKNRLHLDLSPIDADRDAEIDRLEALGARRAESAANTSWVVMLDPEGNEFCVLRSLAPGYFTL